MSLLDNISEEEFPETSGFLACLHEFGKVEIRESYRWNSDSSNPVFAKDVFLNGEKIGALKFTPQNKSLQYCGEHPLAVLYDEEDLKRVYWGHYSGKADVTLTWDLIEKKREDNYKFIKFP